MWTLVLLLACSLVVCSHACTTNQECNDGSVICGTAWHATCDHSLCTCIMDGQILGCLADSDCNDGVHVCQDQRSQWRCVHRVVNGTERNVCTCLRN